MDTWRKLIADEMDSHGDSWATMVGYALTLNRYDEAVAPSFDREFDGGYGSARGDHFTVWTETRVYFPVVYDGAEWVRSVPRNPCDEATEHVGGG